MDWVREQDGFALQANGTARKYPIIELPPAFLEWNLGQRLGFLQRAMDPNHGSRGAGFGAHLPVYVTHNGGGSLFPVNAAVKGTGFVPKEEHIPYYLRKFRALVEDPRFKDETPEAGMARARKARMEAIIEFYGNPEKIDRRCLAGLQIWPGATAENFRADPRVSLHFLGMPVPGKSPRYQQWQINCVWEEIAAGDPRFEFGRMIRELTLGKIGQSFVLGHVPLERTPIRGTYPSGWVLWVVEAFDKGLDIPAV